MTATPLVPGQVIAVSALHADGARYRWWNAIVEQAGSDLVVTVSAAGRAIYQPDKTWAARGHIRAFYWLDKPYNLLEVYSPDGSLEQLYVNIASVPTVGDGALAFTDHELDVVMLAGESAQIVDEDEFAVAIGAYGYTPAFQVQCWDAAREALELAERWVARGWALDGLPAVE